MYDQTMKTLTVTVPDHLEPVLHHLGDQLPLVLEIGMSRFAPLSTQAYKEALSLLAQEPTPEQIVQFHFSQDVESRIETLLAANDAGNLSKAEEVELERLTQLESQLQLVKAKALVSLHKLS